MPCKELAKEQTKLKVSRRKKIIKIREEINRDQSMEVPSKKLKIELSIILLNISKGNENTKLKYSQQLYVQQPIQGSNLSVHQQRSSKDKYISKKYYSDIKNSEIILFATTWLDLEGIMVSKVGQTEKDKHCVLSLMCGF